MGEPLYEVLEIKSRYGYLISLEISSVGNTLWDYMHQVICHKGIDVEFNIDGKHHVN